MSSRDVPLHERKAEVLKAVVSHYVRSGEPVASKTIVEQFQLGVSPATVRNDMAALEEGGYIYQPHTSAGRVPTDAGYRYFVDAWTQDVRLPAADERLVRTFFGEPRWELEEALQKTAALLSTLTRHAAVVFAPALGPSAIRHVELVGLPGSRAMLVLVTDDGQVESYRFSLSQSLDEVQLEDASEMLNRLVMGVALEKVARAIERSVERFPLELRELVATIVRVLNSELGDKGTERVFLEGTSNIVDEDKFADLETVRQVIAALERRRLLLEVLADAFSPGTVSVRIGSENPIEEMQYCSVITAPYGLTSNLVGSLGVVGPTRMDYRRTIAAVHEVAESLGHMLSEGINE